MTIEEDCLAVLIKQMGPAAKVFLDRQCRHHLKKEASKLQKDDLPELANLCFSVTQTALGVVAAESIKKGILSLE
jgi:hypothetical protein